MTYEHISRAIPPADVNLTHCGDHFSVCANIGSLCCTPETNIMLHVNYTSIFLKSSIAQDQWTN